ncbi:ADP-ribosylation factor-like [Mizuhopecten yessoensis]|uniref:ADP-ribosylation factor 1 n=1 Tax=Mizuhopecten yessoensis TaxID=6573 RepID=A0A210R315_MIZYE|nr:ADP-ribosylation factor-like [Mizuhopecten yessoensis]OWF55418.1 ADP-ribosylation factor 1 [Mizuhopecten yessoensis]
MGLWLTKLYDALASFGEEDPSKIIMLGLDNAGKTTILYKLKLNEVVSSIPTLGFNVETVTPCKGVTFTVWDVGGQDRIRQLWKHYYSGAEGLVYVVDSSDVQRMSEAKDELFGILNSPDMSASCPVVVIANKRDMPNAMKPSEIIDSMDLRSMRNRKWHVQSACAPTGEGIYEAVTELGRLVREYKRQQR